MFRLAADRPNTPGWLPDNRGPILNIGCGEKYIEEAVHLDLPEWDADTGEPIPYDDNHFETIYAIHFLEHIRNPLWVLRELQRILRTGGHLNIALPYYTAQANFQDLDHKTSWCEETWRNTFNNPYFHKGHEGWQFEIGANFIIGIVERNTMLITQLIKTT
jgi:predicted SAM-dependent methyltransferase